MAPRSFSGVRARTLVSRTLRAQRSLSSQPRYRRTSPRLDARPTMMSSRLSPRNIDIAHNFFCSDRDRTAAAESRYGTHSTYLALRFTIRRTQEIFRMLRHGSSPPSSQTGSSNSRCDVITAASSSGTCLVKHHDLNGFVLADAERRRLRLFHYVLQELSLGPRPVRSSWAGFSYGSCRPARPPLAVRSQKNVSDVNILRRQIFKDAYGGTIASLSHLTTRVL